MSEIVFKPWVGKEYGSSSFFSGKKLMILGESHYGYSESNGKEKSKATSHVIKEYIEGNSKYDGRLFNALMKICLDKDKIERDDKRCFFNSIVFYNYLQVSLLKPGHRPTESQWKNSQSAFLNVLEKHSPDRLLVLGKQLWFQLPDGKGKSEDSPDDYFWVYPLKNGMKVLATYIYHPSRYSKGVGDRNSKDIFDQLMNTII